mmetsp:Transcript_29300/g.68118  ORF Transcript_29300/g.68118 Transcript_29300/m.68118 type:complete len:229 (+) Transcript_29300:136-822(+)|eukprot:CAMPEP_0171105340 /NCGR_PEP_ID=MMETSP0766_2-20121228/62492_1 /TAXON_ID=439317 /ORGANISM="Gambierdiscus australes, Strain CAWD 149" /LENGTH=228 /DNA_ID=CAMNT_0011566171 /DNA_START=52 /DNA_END=738 /DNA_ORIENTATION=+
MADDETPGPKPHKANVDDEFLRHPYSGAFVRNPLLDKSRSVPVLLQAREFEHNCLEEALADWDCIKVSESSLREMTAMVPNPSSPHTPLQRAALSRLRDLPSSYEFVVLLKKSTYQAKHTRRRPIEAKTANGVMIDKVCVEVRDTAAAGLGAGLRVEAVNEGLIAVWNRTHPVLQVKPGDTFIRVNEKRDIQGMLEELVQSENLKVTVRRLPPERRGSKSSVESRSSR